MARLLKTGRPGKSAAHALPGLCARLSRYALHGLAACPEGTAIPACDVSQTGDRGGGRAISEPPLSGWPRCEDYFRSYFFPWPGAAASIRRALVRSAF